MKTNFRMKSSEQIGTLVFFMVLGGAIGRPFQNTAEGMLLGAILAAILISSAAKLDK